MMTAEQSLSTVQSSAESIRSGGPQRFPEAASVGDVWRQGDIYIELLASVPAGAKQIKKPVAQLAPGTTHGSRHILDSLRGIKMFTLARPTVLDGPILVTTEECVIAHPEHGDVTLPPGCYGITYQRQFADELRRVMD